MLLSIELIPILKHNRISLDDVHDEPMNDIASQAPNNVWGTCKEWSVVLLMNPSDVIAERSIRYEALFVYITQMRANAQTHLSRSRNSFNGTVKHSATSSEFGFNCDIPTWPI